MLKNIILNSGVQILGRGISLIFSVLLTSILTRRLGISGYGNYVLITTLINLLITTANWGTQIIGVRELSRSKDQSILLTNIAFLRLMLCLGTLVVGGLIILFLPVYQEIKTISLILLPAVILTSFEQNFYIIFQTKIRMELKTLFQVVDHLLIFVFSLFFLNQGWGLAAPLTGILIAKTIVIIFSYPTAVNLIKPKITINWAVVKKIFIAVLPLGIQLSLFTAYDQAVDSFIIKNYLGTGQVGIYGLAYRIYANLVLPAYYLNSTILPLLSGETAKSKKSFKIGLGLTIIGAGIVFLSTFAFSGWVVNFISGPVFSPSAGILRILSVSLIFAYLNHINGFFLIARDRQIESLAISAIALTWNTVFNISLIPEFGVAAAAWVTVSTEALVSLISTWRVIRCYNRRT